MKKALSRDEQTTYRKCKADIKKSATNLEKDFRVLGERIKTVHEQQLWRAEYDDFEEFCREELPFGWKRAYQLMRAVSVSTNVENEGQARELLGLEPAEQEAVVALAEAADGEVTGPGLRSAREELEEATKDKEGDEKAETIAEIVAKAEQEAAAKKPPASKGRSRAPKEKDRKSAVDKLLDRALHFGRLARKEWQGLDDVAEDNDQDWHAAVTLLERIQERSRNSTELNAAA